ncbi:MAG: trypsin-like peptidase domain-containing protein [Planctomycetota bacterium]
MTASRTILSIMLLLSWGQVSSQALGLAVNPASAASAGRQDETAVERARRRTPVVVAVERALPTVVDIRTKRLARRSGRHPLDAFFDFGDRRRNTRKTLKDHSLGSGVIISAKGYVVTNDHVIRQADIIEVKLADGRNLKARVVGRDSDNDIAILKIEGAGPFPTIALAASHDVMLGEPAIAMGNPFGLEGSVTTGIVSARNRSVEFRGKKMFEDFLQTSAVINPGNSGGPLLNINGRLIGINVAIHSRGPGIGFAIPVSRLREVVYRLLDSRVVKDAWTGIEVDHHKENIGAIVNRIEAGSPSARAGMLRGDIIAAIDGVRIRDWIDFQTRIDEAKVGQTFRVDYRRQGRTQYAQVKLLMSPPTQNDRAAFAWIGFEFRSLSAREGARARVEGGVTVTRIAPGSAAEKIGLAKGDHLYQLGGFAIRDRRQAMAVISRAVSNRQSRLKVSLYRPQSDEHLTGTIGLERRPRRRVPATPKR